MIRAVRAWSVFVRAVGGRAAAVSLDARIVELEPWLVELRAEIEGLRSRNAELEARRGKDSGNSSRPPSPDGRDRRVRQAVFG